MAAKRRPAPRKERKAHFLRFLKPTP